MIDRLARYIAAISFQRGLALGALVGAVIAGSTVWTRIRGTQSRASVPDESVTGTTGSPSQGR